MHRAWAGTVIEATDSSSLRSPSGDFSTTHEINCIGYCSRPQWRQENTLDRNTAATAATYLMESAVEGARLEVKTDATAAFAQLGAAGLRTGMKALDVGCGTGAVARVMARMAGAERVVGVDQSPSRLGMARELAADVTFLEGDATALPLPDDEFDFSWSRFLFEYLPEPERALTEMIRVTKPGGIVAVADLDAQLSSFHPMPPEMRAELAAAMSVVTRLGLDPEVGRKLFTWFQRAGLVDIQVSAISHQVHAGGLGPADLSNWTQKISTSMARISDAAGEPERWARLGADLLALLQRPDGFYYSTLILVRGVVPPWSR
jgi:ubiquinone/menaquinone biosynthesis C-methylase UbiE